MNLTVFLEVAQYSLVEVTKISEALPASIIRVVVVMMIMEAASTSARSANSTTVQNAASKKTVISILGAVTNRNVASSWGYLPSNVTRHYHSS